MSKKARGQDGVAKLPHFSGILRATEAFNIVPIHPTAYNPIDFAPTHPTLQDHRVGIIECRSKTKLFATVTQALMHVTLVAPTLTKERPETRQ